MNECLIVCSLILFICDNFNIVWLYKLVNTLIKWFFFTPVIGKHQIVNLRCRFRNENWNDWTRDKNSKWKKEKERERERENIHQNPEWTKKRLRTITFCCCCKILLANRSRRWAGRHFPGTLIECFEQSKLFFLYLFIFWFGFPNRILEIWSRKRFKIEWNCFWKVYLNKNVPKQKV